MYTVIHLTADAERSPKALLIGGAARGLTAERLAEA